MRCPTCPMAYEGFGHHWHCDQADPKDLRALIRMQESAHERNVRLITELRKELTHSQGLYNMKLLQVKKLSERLSKREKGGTPCVTRLT